MKFTSVLKLIQLALIGAFLILILCGSSSSKRSRLNAEGESFVPALAQFSSGVFNTSEVVQSHEIRRWLKTLPIFSSVSLYEILIETLGDAGGANNEGVFVVKINGRSQEYIVKLSAAYDEDSDPCDEFKTWEEIASKLEAMKYPADEPIQFGGKVLFYQEDNLNRCLGLLEKAPGVPLKMNWESPEDKEKILSFARALGRLHAKYGITHGDAHEGNILYFESNKQFVFIDNSSVSNTAPSKDLRSILNSFHNFNFSNVRTLLVPQEQLSQYKKLIQLAAASKGASDFLEDGKSLSRVAMSKKSLREAIYQSKASMGLVTFIEFLDLYLQQWEDYEIQDFLFTKGGEATAQLKVESERNSEVVKAVVKRTCEEVLKVYRLDAIQSKIFSAQSSSAEIEDLILGEIQQIFPRLIRCAAGGRF